MRGHYTVKTDIDTYIIFYVEKETLLIQMKKVYMHDKRI